MSRILSHQDGEVRIDEGEGATRVIQITAFDTSRFVPLSTCTTRYSHDLIEDVLRLRGPIWLCDEITRDESPTYLPLILSRGMFSFVDPEEFRGKRLLDFGCGAGASTVVLARLLPNTEIVGIDLNDHMLDVARARARHYGFPNIQFLRSPAEEEVPEHIGTFDFISFSAVYEHMLPAERRVLMPKIWGLLKPGGVLFVNQTPNRLFPLESHTTGLPLLNYLPDGLALKAARRFSKRVRHDETWETLLRKGVRGGTDKDILRRLGQDNGSPPVLLKPTPAAAKTSGTIVHRAKHAVYRGIGVLTGSSFGPWVRIAIRKPAPVTQRSSTSTR